MVEHNKMNGKLSMEKEEKVIAILLTMAILSLAVAYVTYFPNSFNKTGEQPLTDSTEVGKTVTIEGTLYSKEATFNGNHLILQIDYNSDLLTVFIPEDNGAMNIDSRITVGDKLRIKGEVDEYKGEQEIIVKNENDIKKM
ncbi:MAG: nucleic acid binding OB-fold tRNA/helicase-type [Methanohalophilus sp. 2-GBenrich]|nr:MAG: nucleic acid binding OB-fold tRNA/helicase-type [Methanohalophilus sp. 2-GBenrich]RSD35506.1 MAG: nucleic acid binding OB-fold tRNA/helicase-type [Methanohalophilus sp.]RXG33576.1 nucleic acid binding OB-fold tRNA/helicase-type [Methanohalophilus sp. WG1-DM]